MALQQQCSLSLLFPIRTYYNVLIRFENITKLLVWSMMLGGTVSLNSESRFNVWSKVLRIGDFSL